MEVGQPVGHDNGVMKSHVTFMIWRNTFEPGLEINYICLPYPDLMCLFSISCPCCRSCSARGPIFYDHCHHTPAASRAIAENIFAWLNDDQPPHLPI